MRHFSCSLVHRILALGAVSAAIATTVSMAEANGEKYLLRYQFHPGETIRWEVEHRTNVRTTVGGATSSVETLSKSMKVWRVRSVHPDGNVTFEHSVEWLDMRQRQGEAKEIRYDSRTGQKPPPGYQDVAKAVGVPLVSITMDGKGEIIRRERHNVKAMSHHEGCMTIPLPAEAVPIGFTWSHPEDIEVPLETGGVKKVKALQQFTLEDVQHGVAVIRVSTDMLTPISNPAIEAKLVQNGASGRVRFDIETGRVLSQQMDIDKRVIGFRGHASSIHYLNRFCEKLAPASVAVAKKPDDPKQK